MARHVHFMLVLVAMASSVIGVASGLLEAIVEPASLNAVVSATVNSSVQRIYQFDVDSSSVSESGALRLFVSSPGSLESEPVMVVVRHKSGVLSWQLPLSVRTDLNSDDLYETAVYYSANRTLCTANYGNATKAWFETVVVSISTSSIVDTAFSVVLYVQENFRLKLDQPVTAVLSPSAPIYFSFELPLELDSALLRLTSPDEHCMTLSVQNASCPVHDVDASVQFEGSWQTVDTRAGMTVRKEDYPNGAFVVLVVRGDDNECKQKASSNSHGPMARSPGDTRLKTATLSAEQQITRQEYLYATLGALAIFLGAYVVVLMISCVLCINTIRMPGSERERLIVNSTASGSVSVRDRRGYSSIEVAPSELQQQQQQRGEYEPLEGESHPEEAKVAAVEETVGASTVRRRAGPVVSDDDDELGVNGISSLGCVSPAAPASRYAASEDSSIDETDIDMLLDADLEKDVFRTKTFVYVADLARKSPQVLSKKSNLYHWNLATMAIFYGLPVIQLVLTYQYILNSTGNEDLCYYNFLCAHKLGQLADFNHVFSNLGYIMLGVLFMLIVWRKDLMHRRMARANPEVDTRYGIPQHFGMYYAMGLALIMEGVMSGCYHVCPNHTNFQFDTAFMYTIAILIMLKIYQTRHPDINANAYTAFGVLAFVILVGVIGVLHGNQYFWIFFVGLHVVATLLLSIQIYYMGRWRLDAGIFLRMFNVCNNDTRALLHGNWRGLKPMYPDRFVLLLVLNVANWSLDAYGISAVAKVGGDFASFLLAVFISNLMLYTLFYIAMKLRHGERVLWQPAFYLLVSLFTWSGALYFFLNKSTSWVKTPAQSRHLNMECRLFHFYDNHDIWHFLSAASLFLDFMILLSLDDDLSDVPRDKIPVF